MRAARTVTVPAVTPLIVKRPAASVVAPRRVPTTVTATPVSGCPPSPVTVPETRPVACVGPCACRGSGASHRAAPGVHASATAAATRTAARTGPWLEVLKGDPSARGGVMRGVVPRREARLTLRGGEARRAIVEQHRRGHALAAHPRAFDEQLE